MHAVAWRQPTTFTVFADLPADRADAVRAHLADRHAAFALDQLDELHTLRIVVLDATMDLRGRPLPARLLISAVFDGEPDAFVGRWLAVARPALVALLAFCAGFPTAPTDAELRAWLLARAVHPNTFHIGAVRTSVADLRAEDALARALRQHVDGRAAGWAGWGPEAIVAELRAFVAGRPELPQGPRPGTPVSVHLRRALDLARILGLLLAAPAGAAAAVTLLARLPPLAWPALTVALAGALGAAWFLAVRVAELVEPNVVITPDRRHVRSLVELEDHGPRNAFTMVSLVRDSAFRRANLALTLWLSMAFSRHLWNDGTLAGVDTIHFARIHRIDGGRRMLFLSDFDGAWERYLFDFLGTGWFAVIPNWTNLHGCPKTRFMLWPRPEFGTRFLPFTRAMQVRTDLWYAAAAHLSVPQILRNAEIRALLFAPGPRRAARLLELL